LTVARRVLVRRTLEAITCIDSHEHGLSKRQVFTAAADRLFDVRRGLYPWRNDHLLRPRHVVTTKLEKEFTAIAEGRPGGGIAIKLPFDPSAGVG
jgi:hypothetical protein